MENQLQRKYTLQGFTFDQYRIVAQLVQELVKHYLISEQDLLKLSLFISLTNIYGLRRQKFQTEARELSKRKHAYRVQVEQISPTAAAALRQVRERLFSKRHIKVKMSGVMAVEEFNRIFELFKKKAQIKIEPHQINQYYKELIPKLEIRSNIQNITELINDIMRLVPAKTEDAD